MSRTTTQIQDLITAAYQIIAPQAGAWIRLVDLRIALGDIDRPALDEAIDAMYPEAEVMPESNRKTLGGEDERDAIWSGGEWNHLIKIR